MAINVEPSQEVTGGILADDVFDLGLMDYLGQKSVEYIRAQGRADLKQVCIFLRSLSASEIDLSDENIFRILETQVFDNKIEHVETSQGSGSSTTIPNRTYKA